MNEDWLWNRWNWVTQEESGGCYMILVWFWKKIVMKDEGENRERDDVWEREIWGFRDPNWVGSG